MTWRLFRPLHMVFAVAVATFLTVGALCTGAFAADVIYGYVQHVSVDNIKYQPVNGQGSETFTLVPSFDQIFSVDGKTTYQMKDLQPGTFVKIYSDKGLLGKRADKIIVEKASK